MLNDRRRVTIKASLNVEWNLIHVKKENAIKSRSDYLLRQSHYEYASSFLN